MHVVHGYRRHKARVKGVNKLKGNCIYFPAALYTASECKRTNIVPVYKKGDKKIFKN